MDPRRDTIIIEVAPSILRTDPPDQDNLSRALQLLAAGQLDEARIYLEELLRQDPDNPDILYNLGLCYVDLGQLDKGIGLLNRCLQIAPQHSNASVALGIAYQKKGDLAQRARDLAYRLYSICERQEWSQESQAYNSLVTAWPRLTELGRKAEAQRSLESFS